MKKLYRSDKDKILGGVLAGFAEHIEKDPTLVRLGYVLITLIFNIPGILFYIICWIIIPKKNDKVSRETNSNVPHETDINKNDFDVSHETNESKNDVTEAGPAGEEK